MTAVPDFVPNFIGNELRPAALGARLAKFAPHTGKQLSEVAASDLADVAAAVEAARAAQPSWAQITPVARGQILSDIVSLMKARRREIETVIALEAGKPPKDAAGEVSAAILVGEFFAGEGMRLYGRSLPSSMAGKMSHTIRQPHGVVALIVPANTPIANVAWKVFPALICGNAAVLKASEDTPYTAILFAQIARDAGLPAGVLNVVNGSGVAAGRPLVEHAHVSLISFTGSTATGRWIAETAARRLARVSLELGGKNPFVVCDDADLEQAVHWAALSAFSNAGQRCAAGSRIIVMERVYDAFVEKLAERARCLRLGVADNCDLGPVINSRQLESILRSVAGARGDGGRVLTGGERATASGLADGYYTEPTLIENLAPGAALSRSEIFGPVASLYKVRSLDEALALANDTEYGLTAAIHTRDINRAMTFCNRVRAGVANVNLGTFGSEPHMPFGGFGMSGNGTREPGTEALDVYSEIKNISVLVRESAA